MAYTYSDLKTDIRNYTEVDSNVLSDSILTSIVKKAETKIYTGEISTIKTILRRRVSKSTTGGWVSF